MLATSRGLRETKKRHRRRQSQLEGAGELEKAKTALGEARALAPEYVAIRLAGTSVYGRSEDRKREYTFLRIAAGFEDAKAADDFR